MAVAAPAAELLVAVAVRPDSVSSEASCWAAWSGAGAMQTCASPDTDDADDAMPEAEERERKECDERERGRERERESE